VIAVDRGTAAILAAAVDSEFESTINVAEMMCFQPLPNLLEQVATRLEHTSMVMWPNCSHTMSKSISDEKKNHFIDVNNFTFDDPVEGEHAWRLQKSANFQSNQPKTFVWIAFESFDD
jgi:hypothetical protein